MPEKTDCLSQEEKDVLIAKILKCKRRIDSDIGGGCLFKALELHDRHGEGKLFWVGELSKLNLNFGLHHTYYIPNGANDEDIALNQADNGYHQYPRLTVREARAIGTLQNVDTIREFIRRQR